MNEEETYITVIMIFVLFFIVCGLTYYGFIYKPNLIKNSHKILKNEQSKIENKIKINKNLGKKNYNLFIKYKNEEYTYRHNKKMLTYLKKSAYEGYKNAEYKYAKYILKSIKLKNIFRGKNNKYIRNSQINEYGKALAFIKLSAKQNYTQALFQIAMLYKNGGVAGYNYIAKYQLYSKSKNKNKIKKLLYLLASKKYKPAMIIVNKLYNK